MVRCHRDKGINIILVASTRAQLAVERWPRNSSMVRLMVSAATEICRQADTKPAR